MQTSLKKTTPDGKPTRVMFIHPAYPSQFSDIAEALHARPEYECCGLVYHSILHEVAKRESKVPYFGFNADGQPTEGSYPYVNPFESGIRNARGIAHTLYLMREQFPVDVVVGHAGFGATLYAKSVLDCPVVSYTELPGYQSSAARPEFPLTLDQLLSSGACESLNYASILHSDLGVVPSEHTKRLFPAELHHKIRVQMEGFDTRPRTTGMPQDRAALGLPVGVPLVGFFARTLEAVRGFDIFAKVARRLLETDPTIQFLVLGDEQSIYGNERLYLNGQSFKQYALGQAGLAESQIHWRSFMPYENFRQYIGCLDMVILPLFEGAANWNLFEAMASGLPILASNRCFVPEAIRNGREGILLDAYDIEGFARHALALIREPRRARLMGEAARKKIQEHFSVEKAADGYHTIIQEAIQRHQSHKTWGWKMPPLSQGITWPAYPVLSTQ